MSVPIPDKAKRRLVSGMPAITVMSYEDCLLLCELISQHVLDGEWLIEYGRDGESEDYEILDMNSVGGRESVKFNILVFAKETAWDNDWLGVIPLQGWDETFDREEKEKRLEPPDKLTVYTYDEYNQDSIGWCISNFNFTTGDALAKRLSMYGSLDGKRVVSKVVTREAMLENPMMPFMSDYVREAFNIAPYHYWKDRKGAKK